MPVLTEKEAANLKPGDRLICRNSDGCDPGTAKLIQNAEAVFKGHYNASVHGSGIINVYWIGINVNGYGWMSYRFEKVSEESPSAASYDQVALTNIKPDYMSITREIAGAGKRSI